MLLRAFLYHGFNADEKNRQVFDGIMAHVAGGRRSFLGRFAQPSRTAGPLRNGSFFGTDQFPFSDVPQTDPITGVRDGVLARAEQSGVVPKIFYTNSSYEYWGSGASLLHTTTDGSRDIPPPANTRVYLLSGGQHGPAAFPPRRGRGRQLANPNDYRWIMRALLAAMQRWITSGEAPPPSRYPTLAERTLVSADRLAVPKIEGFVPLPPYTFRRMTGLGGQKEWRASAPFAVLVPQVDGDGNEIAGVKMPQLQAPLATYTGWNYRRSEAGAPGVLLANTGSYLPFPHRASQVDSRRSWRERYTSKSDYVERVRAAADRLVQDRFLLAHDVDKIVARAVEHWDLIAGVESTKAGSSIK